jgi:hypothetical protein
MWRRVVCWDAADVSDEHIASFFLLTCWFLLKISSTLEMEAICSSETSIASQQTTRRHIPEDDTLHNHSCENPVGAVNSREEFQSEQPVTYELG